MYPIILLILSIVPQPLPPASRGELFQQRYNQVKNFFEVHKDKRPTYQSVYVTCTTNRYTCYIEMNCGRYGRFSESIELASPSFLFDKVEDEKEMWEEVQYAMRNEYKFALYFWEVDELQEYVLEKLRKFVLGKK